MKSPEERLSHAVMEAWEELERLYESWQFNESEAVRFYQRIKDRCEASIDGIEGGREDGDR